MKYYRRFRSGGEPFYIDEGGNVVDEAKAKTNLIESSTGRQMFHEYHSLQESNRRQSRERVSVNVREKMESAFCRHLTRGYTRTGGLLSEADSPHEPMSAMEQAFARTLRTSRM